MIFKKVFFLSFVIFGSFLGVKSDKNNLPGHRKVVDPVAQQMQDDQFMQQIMELVVSHQPLSQNQQRIVYGMELVTQVNNRLRELRLVQPVITQELQTLLNQLNTAFTHSRDQRRAGSATPEQIAQNNELVLEALRRLDAYIGYTLNQIRQTQLTQQQLQQQQQRQMSQQQFVHQHVPQQQQQQRLQQSRLPNH